ncbi:HEAT repeat domain-containing protein [Malonomonas rubra]|uniref:HEAT repeat domain-containing protein n=1 Tax=Malonomonas rubra TaxID=57040 RepID=UPI0009342907|nr:hypothetical protein [Malonomonas rubra]
MDSLLEPTQKKEEQTRLLASFIHELNITRRHLNTYPAGHPIIDSAYDKLRLLLTPLFKEYPKFAFGVAKGTLLFDHQWLDRNNPRINDFAKVLSKLDIAAVHFHSQPEKVELLRFAELINLDQQKVSSEGGLEKLLKQQDFTCLEITPVDYSVFRITEQDVSKEELDEKLWENFISRLLEGHSGASQRELDPAAVAEILNSNFALGDGSESNDFEQIVSDFIRHLKTAKVEKSGEQFAALVRNLAPQLKQQFIATATQQLDRDPTVSMEDLQAMPPSLIEMALKEFNDNQLNISATMINLVSNLHSHHQRKGRLTSGDFQENDNTADHLRTLFQEEDKGKFTPDSYQLTLDRITNEQAEFNLPEADKENLLQLVLNSSTEMHNCAIIFNLLGKDEIHAESRERLQENLIDLADYFLATGGFKGLNYIQQRLRQHQQRHPDNEENINNLQQHLNAPEFYQEILDNIDRWDEQKQKEITAYIKSAGAGITEALLKRLTIEEDKSLRRTYLNTLAGFGKVVHPVIYKHLHDERWFVIRNMLTILRMQQDPIDLKKLRHLEKSSNLRVNQEYLQLLFKFDRNRATELLSKQLQSNNPQLQIHAVQLATQSNDPATGQLLLKMLHKERLKDENLQLKMQLVRSLCVLADKAALPTLKKLLNPGFLYTSKRKIELQKEIVRNLHHYPAQSVERILKKLARSRRKGVNSLAADKLRQLHRKQQ